MYGATEMTNRGGTLHTGKLPFHIRCWPCSKEIKHVLVAIICIAIVVGTMGQFARQKYGGSNLSSVGAGGELELSSTQIQWQIYLDLECPYSKPVWESGPEFAAAFPQYDLPFT
jgi:hypothetical protein